MGRDPERGGENIGQSKSNVSDIETANDQSETNSSDTGMGNGEEDGYIHVY